MYTNMPDGLCNTWTIKVVGKTGTGVNFLRHHRRHFALITCTWRLESKRANNVMVRTATMYTTTIQQHVRAHTKEPILHTQRHGETRINTLQLYMCTAI